MKPKIDPNRLNYWIGKETLKCWKKMALARQKISSKIESEPRDVDSDSPAEVKF